MPLTTSRMFTVRGWPPSLGAGIRDSNMAHSWPVRSLGYLFSSFSISLPSPHRPSLLSYLLFKHPLTAARVRGRRGGRPKALTGKQLGIAQDLYEKRHSIAEICRTLKIAKATLYRHIKIRERDEQSSAYKVSGANR